MLQKMKNIHEVKLLQPITAFDEGKKTFESVLQRVSKLLMAKNFYLIFVSDVFTCEMKH